MWDFIEELFMAMVALPIIGIEWVCKKLLGKKEEENMSSNTANGLGPIGNSFAVPTLPGGVIAVSSASQVISGSWVIRYADPVFWPFNTEQDLSPQEAVLVKDFKDRHPDWDTYRKEMELILHRHPGLGKNAIFVSLLYETAVNLKKWVDEVISKGASEAKDGKTEEGEG